jgi:cell division protein FtsB
MSEDTTDLQRQVTTLQAQVSALERKVSALQDQLNALLPSRARDDGDEGDISFPVPGPGG